MSRRLIATHTYSILEVSEGTFNEIAGKLREAGYHHCFNTEDGKTVIDMAGLALQSEKPDEANQG